MRDTYGDEIVFDRDDDAGTPLFLRCQGSIGLNPKKARKLARKLIAAADELDGGSTEFEPASAESVDALLQRLRVLEAWKQDRDKVIGSLVNEQRWDREQIVALMRDVYAEAIADGEAQAREAATMPRVNATPKTDEVHYLIPASWCGTRTLSALGRASFMPVELPNDVALQSLVSTGFDEPIRPDTARAIRLKVDDLKDAVRDHVSRSAYENHFRPLLSRLYSAVGGV